MTEPGASGYSNSLLVTFQHSGFLACVSSDLFQAGDDLLGVNPILKKEHTAGHVGEVFFAHIQIGGHGNDHVVSTRAAQLHELFLRYSGRQ